MATAYTRGAKLRAKKAGMPDLAQVPKKQPNGRKRRPTGHMGEKAPEKTALEARARQTGKSAKDLGEMRHPAYGEAAGRAIYSLHGGDTAKRLWDAYAGYTAAEATYAKTYLGLRLHAKTAKVEYLIEVFEARPDDRPDLRTEEERSRDAANRWMEWQGRIMHLPRHQQAVIRDVAYGNIEPMDAGQVTAQGRRFVEAIERLADVVDKK
jgi:hypothetical protein